MQNDGVRALQNIFGNIFRIRFFFDHKFEKFRQFYTKAMSINIVDKK